MNAQSIDLNCDLGEMPDTQSVMRDIEILSMISSCNIACGGHAGNNASMAEMVHHANINNVRIGAHPSYPDVENFGRKSMVIDRNQLRQSLRDQISALIEVADNQGVIISYVKPHGALYNDAADDCDLSSLIVETMCEIDSKLAIMGLAGSRLENISQAKGIHFIPEAFIDRSYTSDARLQSRSIQGSVITDIEQQKQQALALVLQNSITTASGQNIIINAQSLCIHSDSEGALSNAKQIREMLVDNDIEISANHV